MAAAPEHHTFQIHFEGSKIRLVCILIFWSAAFSVCWAQTIDGTLIQWHRLTLTFDGPEAAEWDETNPFSDYRLDVTFTKDGKAFRVPGFFAADGMAAETSASSGNKWRAHFTPMYAGTWSYRVSFVQGTNVAISPVQGEPVLPHGVEGSFEIAPADDSPSGRGHLQYVGQRYLRYAGNGRYFLKSGADAPETFLAFEDFDGTSVRQGGFPLKSWQPHIGDWSPGDPVWQQDKGKGIIGAINYLANQGQNAFSFLPMNLEGDGRNVWPYSDPDEFDRFDCSKLDQWEIVFEHADRQGMFLHFKTQETENDQLLDGGALGRERKLYYRELIARFGHHLALNWNLGEENSNTTGQLIAFADYLDSLDIYDHPIVVHTFPNQDDEVYSPLIGNQSRLHGASIQTNWSNVHARTKKWISLSEEAGRAWVVANDEQGSAVIGVPHDDYLGKDPDQDDIRKSVLWGNLMAGGAGVEYYFGYALPHSDLFCEDFRSRENMWMYNRNAIDFFTSYLPFWGMTAADDLVNEDNYCMTDSVSTIAIYVSGDTTAVVDLSTYEGLFSVAWYDPVSGGALQHGSVTSVAGGAMRELGRAPGAWQDWAILLKRDGPQPMINTVETAPAACTRANLRLELSEPQFLTHVLVQRSLDGINYNDGTVYSVTASDRYLSIGVSGISSPVWFRITPFAQNSAFDHIVSRYFPPLPCTDYQYPVQRPLAPGKHN